MSPLHCLSPCWKCFQQWQEIKVDIVLKKHPSMASVVNAAKLNNEFNRARAGPGSEVVPYNGQNNLFGIRKLYHVKFIG